MLFAGGNTAASSTSRSATIDSFNSSLVRTNTLTLSEARGYLGGTSLREHAIFSCGGGTDLLESNVIDSFDVNLVRTTFNNILSEALGNRSRIFFE